MLPREFDGVVREVMGAARIELNSLRLTGESDRVDEERASAIVGGIVDRHPLFSLRPEGIRRQAAEDVSDNLFRLGPLEVLLTDEAVTEIMVNGPDDIWIEHSGKIKRSEQHFFDDEHIRSIIVRIAEADNRRCDEGAPLCDCILHRPGASFDGSRVNAVVPIIAVDHPLLSIRKFHNDVLKPRNLIDIGAFDNRMGLFMKCMVRGRMNIVISGGTGTGKTTLLNALSLFIPDGQRIVTIEDTPELYINKPQVVRLQSRPANAEGKGTITIMDLVINALRMRPDRIVVGECRGAEAFDMLQAMSTGHDGSLTTIHANNPRECVDRLQSMIQLAGHDMPVRSIREFIANAIDFIVAVRRFPDGSRRVVEITEVCGMQGDMVTMAPIMRFEQDPFTGGKVTGRFVPTGDRPTDSHIDRMTFQGVDLDGRLFVR